MKKVQIIWNLDDDPEGNVQHLLEHDVSKEEFEEVYHETTGPPIRSHSSGNPMKFGWTSTGKYLAIVWEVVSKDPPAIYPLTAYPVSPPRRRKKK